MATRRERKRADERHFRDHQHSTQHRKSERSGQSSRNERQNSKTRKARDTRSEHVENKIASRRSLGSSQRNRNARNITPKKEKRKSPPRSSRRSNKDKKELQRLQSINKSDSSDKQRKDRSKSATDNYKKDSRKRGSSPSTNTHPPNKKPKKSVNPFIHYNDRLTRIIAEDSSEILMALLDNYEAFCEFIKGKDMSAKSVEEILEILSKLYDTPYTKNFAKIFVIFQDATFLNHLRRYILRLPYHQKDEMEKKVHVERIIRFIHELLNRFPDTCEDLPLDALITFTTTNNNCSSGNKNYENDIKQDSSTDDNDAAPVNAGNSINEDQRKQIKDNILKLKSLREELLKRKHSPTNTSVIENKAPDDYRSIPVFPRQEDIFPDKPPFLRKNIIRGRYTDVTHYLDIQFRLLREDYIAPIRDGVLEARSVQGNSSRSIHVYRNVRVVGYLFDTKCGGLLHRVQFDVSRMRRVNWKHSKRFKYGSLYCLIDINRRSMLYFVTITERNPKDLANGFVNMKFFDESRAGSITFEQQFFMIESPAYFESYRHVLEGLQNYNKDNLPFQRYLVECNSAVRPPVYLSKTPDHIFNEAESFEVMDREMETDQSSKRSSHDRYDLTDALECKAKSVAVLNFDEWPLPSRVNLNNSQYNALKAALTQEFVVIQGPPGTGKTFVGLRIATGLLRNTPVWRRRKPSRQNEATIKREIHGPILVVCYTNHALDQFLEGILKITDNVARVGGRGKSEILERYNLKARKKVTKESLQWRDLKRELKSLQAMIENENSVIQSAHNKLLYKDVEKILTTEENEQLQLWERVAYQMQVHRIDAWLKMQDETDDGNRKRKRSYGKIDVTTSDDQTPKRSRNTPNSAKNLNKDGLSKHAGQNKTQEKNSPIIEEHQISKELREGKDDQLNQLEEGELPDSDDKVWYQNDDSDKAYEATRNNQREILQRTPKTTINTNRESPNDAPDNPPQIQTMVKDITKDIENGSGEDVSSVPQTDIQSSSSQIQALLRKPITAFKDCNNSQYSEEYQKANIIVAPYNVSTSYPSKDESMRIERDGVNKDEIVDNINDILSPKQSINKEKEKLNPRIAFSTTNSGKLIDIEEHLVNTTKGSIMLIDKHSTKDSSTATSSEEMNDEEKIMGNNVKDQDELTSRSSNQGEDDRFVAEYLTAPNDILTEDIEEGEIFDTDDDVSDSEHNSNVGIDLTTLMQFNVIRRSKQHDKVSEERRSGVGETLKDAQNEQDEQTGQVDLSKLSRDQRWGLYQEWIARYFEYHEKEIEHLRKQYDEILLQISEIDSIQVEKVLKSVDVIGMTTTGAAKHRLILQEIKPRIVIVEEAAEVLEGHVITALSSGTDHLILIGDHKQLKPNPTVHELAKKYNLDVSLFERMVNNHLKCHSLTTQHRMRPEIADIMRIIYPELVDDESVQHCKSVTGVQHNVYFIDHQEPESENSELKSHSNQHEVNFVVALSRHLLLQGYEATSITVLTMYTGQLLKLKRCMPKDPEFSGIRITSVDNFQGEESHIIILSLVRSNKHGNIGFLNISNRVCVALSRAKIAMYCIGNISMMAERNKLWKKIKDHLSAKSMIGASLPLCCPNHPEKKIEAFTAEDFKKTPQGGCASACQFRLPCGHVCSLPCHPVDPKHNQYRCQEKCLEDLCDLKHRCKKRCHYGEDCGRCNEKVSYTMPSCKHEIEIKCFERGKITCTVPCTKDRYCGHPCGGKCGENCESIKCQVEVPRPLECGHTVTLLCSTDVKNYQCDKPCTKLLDCGHYCSGNCSKCHKGTFHVKCEQPCKRLLVCSHECEEPCTKNCPPCRKECKNRCGHSYCPKLCGEPCTSCKMPCMWACEHHKCTKRCGEICDRDKCNEPCRKPLACDHQCVGVCGEFCPRLCRICNKEELQTIFLGNEDKPDALYIELKDCRHTFEVSDLDYWMEGMEENENSAVQLKVCPRCKTPIRESLRYGNIVKKTLADIERVKELKLHEQRQLQQKRVKLEQRVRELGRKNPELFYYGLIFRIRELRSDEDACYTLENQLSFISRLAEIDEMFFTGPNGKAFVAKSPKLSESKKEIEKLLYERTLLTVQEIKDISDKISFLTLSCQFEFMLWKIDKDHNSSAFSEEIKTSIETAREIMSRQYNAADTSVAITDDERAVVASVIENVNREVGVIGLTPKEREEIVKSFKFSTTGHWYKCPNGHIYVITECGGATEKSKCPVCKEEIGGSQHKVLESNRLAPEMDGATHSAWSDQTNLLNYDPEELRRLQR